MFDAHFPEYHIVIPQLGNFDSTFLFYFFDLSFSILSFFTFSDGQNKRSNIFYRFDFNIVCDIDQCVSCISSTY